VHNFTFGLLRSALHAAWSDRVPTGLPGLGRARSLRMRS